MTRNLLTHQASFRDPAGQVIYHNNQLYRGINHRYLKSYEHFINSGLYQLLIEKKYLIPHEESSLEMGNFAKVIKPQVVEFISYPYEWSFTQLKDAGLLILDIQEIALKHGMILKDASAFNMQFYHGRPILIDTLSFDLYKEGEPWIAYKQFCQHFLTPLAMMARVDIRFPHLLKNYIDGLPLDLVSTLLPLKTWLNPHLFIHIHLHARMIKKYSQTEKNTIIKKSTTARPHLINIMNSLREAINQLEWQAKGTEWAEYYDNTNYSQQEFVQKELAIESYLEKISPNILWDLGANNGHFSRLSQKFSKFVISFDIDPAAVEQHYLFLKKEKNTKILPLLMDLTNPSPAIGWENTERDSLVKRANADCAMALALIHHLTISNNIPFVKVAAFFSSICKYLIIEFIPKSDSQVKKLLTPREDIFQDYTQECFESAFGQFFQILDCSRLSENGRIMYFMLKRSFYDE